MKKLFLSFAALAMAFTLSAQTQSAIDADNNTTEVLEVEAAKTETPCAGDLTFDDNEITSMLTDEIFEDLSSTSEYYVNFKVTNAFGEVTVGYTSACGQITNPQMLPINAGETDFVEVSFDFTNNVIIINND